YPAPERTFAGYPTRLLDGPDLLAPSPRAGDILEILLELPLTNHAPGRRAPGADLLRSMITRAPCSVVDLDHLLAAAGIEPGGGRATIAWMLKYDLLRVAGGRPTAGGTDR